MKITLDLDEVQLGIVLQHIEAIFDRDDIDEAIELAAKRWTRDMTPANDDGGYEYETVKIAPVYRQLLAHWPGDREGGIYYADDLFDFVSALREARQGSRGPQREGMVPS